MSSSSAPRTGEPVFRSQGVADDGAAAPRRRSTSGEDDGDGPLFRTITLEDSGRCTSPAAWSAGRRVRSLVQVAASLAPSVRVRLSR